MPANLENSAVVTELEKLFSFQSQRNAMPKNVQTTTQLHSFHMLARSCSKSSKLGLNSTWTQNFQMYKLDLEKAEEPEIKLPTSAGSWKKQESSLCQSLWLCGSQSTVENSERLPIGLQLRALFDGAIEILTFWHISLMQDLPLLHKVTKGKV